MAAIFVEPGVGRVADDGEQPGTAVAAAKSAEEFVGAQERILHDILGVMLIAGQPAGQIVGRVQMWQNDPLEILYTRNGQPSAFLPVRRCWFIPDHWADLILWIAAPSGGQGVHVTIRTKGGSIHWLPLEHMTIVTVCGV